MRILLIEDDPFLGDTIKQTLSSEGYAVDWLTDGKLGLTAMVSEEYDLVLLDNRLPGSLGVDILKAVRDKGNEVPVLMLTACDSLADKVRGLDAGADDYLTKPFEMDELFARIRSLLRRRGGKAPSLRCGELELDPAERQVTFQGQPIDDLTAKELSVLEALLRNRGRFLTKHRLYESCSSWDEEVGSNTIEVYISRLRKRFGHDLIETLRGVGYRIK